MNEKHLITLQLTEEEIEIFYFCANFISMLVNRIENMQESQEKMQELMEKLEGNMLIALGLKDVIRENAVKRVVVHNTDGQPKSNLYKENGVIKPDIDYAKKDLALTLKMVDDAKKVTATDVFTAKLEHETGTENINTTEMQKHRFMTLEEKKQFLKDYETKSKKYMLKKYMLKNDACLFNKAYQIRKQLKVV